MMELHFAGYFQVRMSTDPDPTDEKRGVSGYTFAHGDEPDFDRIIRFHNPVAPRLGGPEVGVFVKYVVINGSPVPDHPLVGAQLDLADGPQFWMNNYVLVTNAGTQAIEPFHVQVRQADIVLSKQDFLDPSNPQRSIYHIPTSTAQTRGGALSLELAYFREVTGFADPLDFRQQRLDLLMEAALSAHGVEKAALEARIRQFATPPDNRRTRGLTFCETRSFDMNGPGTLQDPRGALGTKLDLASEWPIRFWMGVWDCDTLCGYVKGQIEVPFLPGM